MCNSLKGRKLWRFLTREITKLVKKDGEKDDEFFGQFKDWNSKRSSNSNMIL